MTCMFNVTLALEWDYICDTYLQHHMVQTIDGLTYIFYFFCFFLFLFCIVFFIICFVSNIIRVQPLNRYFGVFPYILLTLFKSDIYIDYYVWQTGNKKFVRRWDG